MTPEELVEERKAEEQLPKPSGWKWMDGERRGWWYKKTVYGVRTGCPCCGKVSMLGYPAAIRHRINCQRSESYTR